MQTCIVHLVRASLNYVGWKERKQVAADLKTVYRAATAEEAEQRLAQFAAQWDSRYAPIAALWRRQWPQVIPFFAFPAEIRKVIYTTNAVESLNMSLRPPRAKPFLHQRRRIAEHESAQGAEAARDLPQRRSGSEGDVPGAAQRDPQVGTLHPLEGGAELLHPVVGGPHSRGDRNVAKFPSPRMILNKACEDRRQGSALRSDERAEERAPLTAVATGQIIQLSGEKERKKNSARDNNHQERRLHKIRNTTCLDDPRFA